MGWGKVKKVTKAELDFRFDIEINDDLKQQIEDIHSIDDITYSYLTIAYNATDHMNVSLSISNLFDKEPPYFKDFFGFVDPQINTPQNTYDVVGRYYTLGFKLTY